MSSKDLENSAELIERCRNGDRKAQRRLFERTSQHIYALLLRMVGNPEDAFDLAQETYMKALTRIEQFTGAASVLTWLHRIAVNEALHFLRQSRRERAHLLRMAAEQESPASTASADALPDVQSALAELEPIERAILLLRYQEGLDYHSIAEILGTAEGTVGSRLNRARLKLRELMEKREQTSEESRSIGDQSIRTQPRPLVD